MNIFREFEKNNDKYIATNNFYISSDDECGNIEYNLFNINSLNKIVNDKIIVYSDNLHINVRNNEYINLITLSNIIISFVSMFFILLFSCNFHLYPNDVFCFPYIHD